MMQGDGRTLNGFHRYVLATKEPADPKTLGLDLWDGQAIQVALHHSPAPSAPPTSSLSSPATAGPGFFLLYL